MSAAAQPSRGHLPKSVRAAQSVAGGTQAAPVRQPYRREIEAPAIAAPARTQRQQVWDSFCSHRAAFISLIILGSMIFICAVGPFVLQDPEAIDYDVLAAQAPSGAHLFGTDQLGRDVLARLVNAGRTSLAIGFVVAFGAAAIGAWVGVMAGYFGGRVDSALMWLVNVLMTIPSLPLLMSVAVLVASPSSAIGPLVKSVPEWFRIAAVLALLGWMGISRVVRSQVVSLRNQEFVEAARALGGTDSRIMLVHILPNCVSVIAVFTTLAVSGAIIGESALSFLGLGVSPPTATWGNMLAEARDLFAIMNYWWTVWFPALAIFITVLSVNFIGDGVRDALDPKSMK
ncbi:MAG: binding-protein-dependent transport system inner rane component [Thermoleophilia bacterium]|nr:binding-protein-dependent transport system inner rane component [Thermoleophilia bacterium]